MNHSHTRLSRVAAAALLAFTLAAARAHSVWIEPLQDSLVVRFGEMDGRMEKSPGHLDGLAVPVTFVVLTNTSSRLEVSKQTNHFALGAVSSTNIVCAETTFAVMAAPGNPGRRPNFYARWHPPAAGAGTPVLTLDLVPTGKPGEVRVYFRGEPAPGVKAVYRTPDEKERELTSDAEGFLHFTPAQPGQYHLGIGRHSEALRGFFGGKAHGLTSHNAALTWAQ